MVNGLWLMVSSASTYKMLKYLKIPETEIERVMGDGEYDVSVPEGVVVLDAAELRGVKEKVKYAYRRAYPEIFGKELNNKLGLGLSVTDAKDINKVVKAIQMKSCETAPPGLPQGEEMLRTCEIYHPGCIRHSPHPASPP
jgi:hypothetical protein